MVPIAPRYDLRIVDAISALDDRREPMAEICRRVGAYAESKGLFRPSYPHVRRLILTNRAREDELREIREWVARRLIAGRPVDPYDVESKLRSAMELNGA